MATNIIADTVITLIGTIGRHVLANLLPARRLRVCPRIVKRASPNTRDLGPNHRPGNATVSIDILIPTDR